MFKSRRSIWSDSWGPTSRHLQLLRDRRINLEGLQQEEGKTFHWKGYYDEDLNTAHTLLTDLNVFAGGLLGYLA